MQQILVGTKTCVQCNIHKLVFGNSGRKLGKNLVQIDLNFLLFFKYFVQSCS